jgi:lysophospholipase L1-like esterase
MKKRLLIPAGFAFASLPLLYVPAGWLASGEAQTLGERNPPRAVAELASRTAAPACCPPPGAVAVPDTRVAADAAGAAQTARPGQDPGPVFGFGVSQTLAQRPVPGDMTQISGQPAPEQIGAEAGSTSQPRATFRLAPAAGQNHRPQGNRGALTILQIGDSHTAADFFTGEVRRYVQARYGDGGPGYIDAGRPHPGIRSAALNVSATKGWNYAALQKGDDPRDFYLSGFTAKAARGGESLNFSSERPVPFDLVELEVVTGPHSGAVDVAIDGGKPIRSTLAEARQDRMVYRFTPDGIAPNLLRRISITTSDGLPVAISALSIFNKSYGVSYSNIGFPGATVDIVNKFDSKLLKDELKRIAPQIVVLAFGTNEGFNDHLDLAKYRDRYRTVIRKIRSSLPHVTLVMIGPPQAERVAKGCVKDVDSIGCKRDKLDFADGAECVWPVPPKLGRVRELQRNLAKEEGIPFWDWADIMPAKCGATAWYGASPPLVTRDHVHFTAAGYRMSARRFIEFLDPIIAQFQSKSYAFSDH